MALLGITKEVNRIEIYDPEAEFPQPSHTVWPLFEEDKATGDIRISYYTIGGEAIRYLQMGDGKTSHLNAKTKYYETRRLKEPKGDMKYQMPAGQPTLPWFPPALVQKYKNRERIASLVLTEGVFKAMCGSMAGLDVVGLPSVTCYKDRDGRLYGDIVKLIEECEVENVVILWDGDCLDISRKDLQVCEEITRRPMMFFQSTKKIAELVSKLEFKKTRAQPSVWFGHVKSESIPVRPKGLDDLLIAAAEKKARVVEELQKLPDDAFFFYFKNITTATPALHKYFRLNDVKAFYEFHIDLIGVREFKYDGTIYKWSEGKNKLVMEVPGWAKEIKWVGDEFFVEQVVPGAIHNRRVLTHWKEGNFRKLYSKDFLDYIPHYRAFCNIPNHSNYEQIIETPEGLKFYNRYFPFPHAEEQGKWPTILGFIKHIFGDYELVHGNDPEKKYRSWELGLDYVQLLLTKPTQMLPVICLFSPENNTGKSTFGKLMMRMFGDNVVPVGNQDLQSDFNEMYTDKLLAICEETLLERKKDAERIKAMSTAESVMVNPKGQKQYGIDFFCKFIFTSNNIRMIYVTKHDQRFWIIKVPVLTSDNPKILDEMTAELPAFVYDLRRRKMATECESRMWFHHSLIRTPVFDDVVRVNEPSDATNLRDQLREWFIQDNDLQEIRMTLKEITEEFFSKGASIAWVQEILKDYIGVDLKRDKNGVRVHERGHYVKYETYFSTDGVEDIRPVKKAYRGCPYVFPRDKFLTGVEIAYSGDQGAQPGAAMSSAPQAVQTTMQLGNPQTEEDLPF